MDNTPTTVGTGHVVAGRFRLQRSLGAGAMGAVFAAVDETSGTPCAIKVIHPHIAKAGVNTERFRREVTLSQQVGHPGIVRVFDAGQDPDAGLFIVMELLQGVTLRPPLTQGDLTVTQALEVVVATLDALQAAHRIGIVHRDLKPDNIFLHAPDEEAAQVKLLDFGVARQRNAAGLTTTNVGLGTPHFMAPEQATDARSVTAASDVWSAGVMLYYILSGALPFDGDGPYETVLRACTVDHVPLDRRAPETDYRLVDVVEMCLEKDPLERFQDAGELLEVLAPLLRDPRIVEASNERVAAEPRLDAGADADGWEGSSDGWGASVDDASVGAAGRPSGASGGGASAPSAAPWSGTSAATPSGPAAGPAREPARRKRPAVPLAALAVGLAVVGLAALQLTRADRAPRAEPIAVDDTTAVRADVEPLPLPVEEPSALESAERVSKDEGEDESDSARRGPPAARPAEPAVRRAGPPGRAAAEAPEPPDDEDISIWVDEGPRRPEAPASGHGDTSAVRADRQEPVEPSPSDRTPLDEAAALAHETATIEVDRSSGDGAPSVPRATLDTTLDEDVDEAARPEPEAPVRSSPTSTTTAPAVAKPSRARSKSREPKNESESRIEPDFVTF